MSNTNENKKEKNKEAFNSFWKKTSEIAKKTAIEVKKGAVDLSEQTREVMQEKQEQRKKAAYEKRLKKYHPISAKDFKNKKFNLPNVIEIVDDAVRRDIDVCEGAIGWIEEHKGVEILHLYDEYMDKCGIEFIPFARCDNIYCVDLFDRNRFININRIFAKTNDDKIAELSDIAYCLGAKSCSIEFAEYNSEFEAKGLKAKSKLVKEKEKQKEEMGAEVSNNMQSQKSSHASGKREMQFDGNNAPIPPTLKWFAHDDNIKRLVEMCCGETRSVKSETLELSGSSSATMSQKTACAIDGAIGKIGGAKGHASMDAQAAKEHHSKLMFHIEF
jgi:hypothetical protein